MVTTPTHQENPMPTTYSRITKIIVEHLGVEADEVKGTASFIGDLGADSLDLIELVMAFEEEFSIEINSDAAEKITTVADAVAAIDQILSQAATYA